MSFVLHSNHSQRHERSILPEHALLLFVNLTKNKESSATQNCCFRRARKKSSNLSEEVRCTFLDDTFWHESEAIVSLLKPLHSAIIQLEEDSPNLADVCRPFFNFKYEILKSIDFFPFTLLKQEKIKSIVEVRENFCIKIIHKKSCLFF